MKKKYFLILLMIILPMIFQCVQKSINPPEHQIDDPLPGSLIILKAAIIGTDISLNWQIQDSITQYQIFRKIDDLDYEKIADNPANAIGYIDVAVPAACDLSYYVKVYFENGTEGQSNPVQVIRRINISVAVTAVKRDLHLYWSSPNKTLYDDLKYISIIRREDKKSIEIAHIDQETNFYLDENVDFDKNFYYSVVINNNNGSIICSPESQGIAIPDIPVINLTASRLEYTDKIQIAWAYAGAGITYQIYRYSSKINAQNDINSEIFPADTNQFADKVNNEKGALCDHIYFYRVSAIKNELVYPKSKQWVMGIYSSLIDYHEPNNNYQPDDKTGDVSCLAKNISAQAVLYSFSDDLEEDVDWYYYKEEDLNKDFINLKIHLDPESTLNSKIRLHVFNGLSYDLMNDLDIPINLTDNELFFKIEFNSTGWNDVIGSYSLLIQ